MHLIKWIRNTFNYDLEKHKFVEVLNVSADFVIFFSQLFVCYLYGIKFDSSQGEIDTRVK